MRVGPSLGLLAGALILFGAPQVLAECRTTPVVAKGESKVEIDQATQSAYDAMVAKIKTELGPEWTPGSRRGAEYTCVKPMGGQAKRISWTCSLSTYPCRP